MQTDELRAELTELANEVAPFGGDLPAIRRRVARRRIASASLTTVLIVGLIAGAIAATRPNPHRVDIAGSPKDVALAQLAPFDAAVVLPAGATGEDLARVQAVLDGSDAVEQYADLPPSTLAYVLSFSPDADVQALRARVCAAPSTRSFAVKLAQPTPAARQQLTSAIGTIAIVQSTGDHHGFPAEVFMKVKATPAQTAAVREAIERDPDVVKDTYLTHQDAYNEFKKLFADQPALIESETPEGLPESFRIELRDGVSPSTFAARVRGLPAVDQVITSVENQLPRSNPTLAEVCSFFGLISRMP